MADVLDIDNAEEFEVDDEGDRESHFFIMFYERRFQHITSTSYWVLVMSFHFHLCPLNNPNTCLPNEFWSSVQLLNNIDGASIDLV